MSASAVELRTLVRLALPLMAAQLLQMAQGIMDTMMAGHLSARDLAGIALALNVLWPSQFLISGLILAATPIIAQLRGASRVGEVGEVVRQGFWIIGLSALTLIVFWRNAEFVYVWLEIEPQTRAIALGYLDAASWGAFPLLGYFLIRYLCEGMGETRPAMFMALIALIVKLPLNYAFMYGHWGAPKLGGIGTGWASAILWWCEFAGMLLVARMPFARSTGLFDKFSWPKWSILQRFVAIGLPIGVTTFAEVFAFSIMGLMLGRFGPETMAAHQIVGNLNGTHVHGAAGAGHGDHDPRGFQRGCKRLRAGATGGDGRAARDDAVRGGGRHRAAAAARCSSCRCSATTPRSMPSRQRS